MSYLCFHHQPNRKGLAVDCYTQMTQLKPDHVSVLKNGVLFQKDSILEQYFHLTTRHIGNLLFHVIDRGMEHLESIISILDTTNSFLYALADMHPLPGFWKMLEMEPVQDLKILTVVSVNKVHDNNHDALCFRPLRSTASLFCNRYISLEQFYERFNLGEIELFETTGFMTQSEIEGYTPEGIRFQNLLDMRYLKQCQDLD